MMLILELVVGLAYLWVLLHEYVGWFYYAYQIIAPINAARGGVELTMPITWPSFVHVSSMYVFNQMRSYAA